jgi:hypothetical protein
VFPADDQNLRLDHYIVKSYGEETVRAFVPPPLQPDPPVRLDALHRLLEHPEEAAALRAKYQPS